MGNDNQTSPATPEQPTLESERLILRPFWPEDAARVQALAGVREIADTTQAIPHPYPDGAAEAWIASLHPSWESGRGVHYAVTRRETGELVGAVGLRIVRAHAHAELGYWIGTPFWNHGYCTEASQAVIAFAFGALRLHRIFAQHLVRNPASGRVMHKLGMRPEGIHRDAVRKWDRFEDVAVHAILASEWAAGVPAVL